MPGYCYNGMVSPLTSFAVAGAVWYQGESNTVWPSTYSKLLSTMVASWRKAWNRPLSFYYVQIAPFKYEIKDQASLLREQQEKVMSLEHSGMVVVSDLVDDTADIHPKDKHDVGYRLANWALADTYHRKDIIYKNPVYQGMEVQKDKAILSFSEDLEVRMKAPRYPTVRRAVEVKELWIAGEDRVFYPATAEVRGNKMTVSAKAVTKPVAVRYQFSNSGIGNLFGKQGLPVAPFRTDDWNVF
jgi:sialate O-acetylesterase